MFARIKRFFRILGPGLTSGASDDDPSGIGTYSQAGAQFGYTPLWSSLFTFPLLLAIQEMCARIAIVTGKGLVRNMHEHFSSFAVWCVICLVAFANIVNIGADLNMMAAAGQLIVPLPFWFLLGLIVVLTLALQIFLSYHTYARYLKWLTFSLFAYVLVAFVVHVDWMVAFRATFVPIFPFTRDFALIFVALLGTTISPYVHFWQADQEVEDGFGKSTACSSMEKKCMKKRLANTFTDVASGMGYANLVSWFIILTAAAVLNAHGLTDIATADQAARVLEPLSGRFSLVLFALGIIGTGLLAVPILSSVVAYAVCESRNLSYGLSKKWYQAKVFYGIIVLTTVLGIGVNLTGQSPVRLLVGAAVCNAITVPPLLFMILLLANKKSVMKNYKNRFFSNAFGGLALLVMTIASCVGIWLTIFN